MTRAILFFLACVFALSPTDASAYLSGQQARAKAVKILMGDPYGRTAAEVLRNITDAKFLDDGATQACGSVKKAVWQFHVVVASPANNPESPIDGYLVLDGRSGRVVCANLPMLD